MWKWPWCGCSTSEEGVEGRRGTVGTAEGGQRARGHNTKGTQKTERWCTLTRGQGARGGEHLKETQLLFQL